MHTHTTSKDNDHSSASRPFFSDCITSTPFFNASPALRKKPDEEEPFNNEALAAVAAPETEHPIATTGLTPPPDDTPNDTPASGTAPAVQAKLTVGPADDPLEREADTIADRVIHGIDAPGVKPPHSTVATLQRRPEDEEEELSLQTKGGTEGEAPVSVQEGLARTRGLGSDLPLSTRDAMEESLGVNFSDVRVHTDSNAQAMSRDLNARAFTYGSDIYFNAGEYRPETIDGKHLLAHELVHVVQQTGAQSAIPGGGSPPQVSRFTREAEAHNTGPGEVGPESAGTGTGIADESVLLDEETGTPPIALQRKVSATITPIHAAQGIIQRNPISKKNWVPFKIHVEQKMTQEEYKLAAMRQVFGGPLEGLTWHNLLVEYLSEKSPYTLWVEPHLLKEQRGHASQERGIPVGEDYGVTGAKKRAKAFHAGPASETKTALMDEIDRRYWEAVGDPSHTKIKSGETGKTELWRTLRDEVLFQHEYITHFPVKVKELFKTSIKGRDLTPADYDKLFAIAKKIEKIPNALVSDYTSRVTGTTTDLDVFEASLDKYLADVAERDKQKQERDTVHTKLLGLEAVYEKYQLWQTLITTSAMSAAPIGDTYSSGNAGAALGTALVAEKVRKELETELKAHGFSGIDDFAAWIKRYEQAFEKEAANIAKDVLAKFAGKLYRESERYQNVGEVAVLYQRLGGMRASYAEFEANAPIWNAYAKAKQKAQEQARIPGQGHIKTSDYTTITESEAEDARVKAEAAKASAQSQFKNVAGVHPIFEEEGLPDDKKLDKVALAKADEGQLAGIIQAQIQRRMKDTQEAQAQIEDKPELIYKMDKLLPHFYAAMGIHPGSIHDKIIQDKMRSDAIIKLVKGIAVAIVAIALAVISFGTATPAIVAAGAAIAGAGLGVYQAYESYQEYVEEKKLADVGFAKDPSVVWLVVAIAGAALDMAAAVKAVKALAPAAKALNAGGDLAEFTKVVRALEKANEIEANVARAAEKAGAARKSFAAATEDLSKALLGKAYSFPGPFTDPDVYKALVRMAREAIKTKFYDAAKFLEEVKLARATAKLGNLTPEELAKVKQAWEEAKGLEAAEALIESAEQARVGTYTTKIKWGIQTIDARPHTTVKGAFWGRRTPQANPRVNAYELKINPNNESFFLPHPSGGYVQFEELVGTRLVQDGKLVIQQRSIYHVADMPPFATKQILEEARRQVSAASAAGMRVEWLISESRARQQLEALFQKEGIAVTLRLVPE